MHDGRYATHFSGSPASPSHVHHDPSGAAYHHACRNWLCFFRTPHPVQYPKLSLYFIPGWVQHVWLGRMVYKTNKWEGTALLAPIKLSRQEWEGWAACGLKGNIIKQPEIKKGHSRGWVRGVWPTPSTGSHTLSSATGSREPAPPCSPTLPHI